ncbi:MAG: HAMP domain-containing histidine kinase [Planctomycetes bacterium]|nr:HAMP domain-containing histidine kinase [Planctomycetota bacterium]
MIANTKSTWTFGVLLVLVVPAVLVGIWSWLVFGGSIESLATRERDEAREAMAFAQAALREGLDGRPDRANTLAGRVWLRVDDDGAPDPDPFAERASTVPVDLDMDPTWRAGIDYEAAGAWDRAVRFLDHARSRVAGMEPLEGLLALARAHARVEDVPAALTLLREEAERPERRERVTATGLDEAFLLRMTAARIAADSGDREPARSLLQRIGAFEERVPLASQDGVLERLVSWAGDNPPWLAFHRAVADAVRALRHREVLAPSDASLVARPSSMTWLLVDRGYVERLIADVAHRLEERFAHHRLTRYDGVDVVWSEAIPWLDRTLWIESREPRESVRLHVLAQRLLLVALAAFVIGNVLVARSIRQERRLARMRSGFVDLVSHELRTPLTALSLRTEMLACGDVPQEKLAHYGESIHRDVKRLSQLTARILDFARLEKGRLPLARSHTTARTLLARALRESRDVVKAAGRRVRGTGEREPDVRLFVDVEVMTRALANVLENAAKHAIASECIWISSTVQGERLSWCIEDEGPGIDAQERERLFQPFERGRDAQGRAGSGLGLSFVRQALRAHGGAVTLAASPRGGARFTLSLPREDGA